MESGLSSNETSSAALQISPEPTGDYQPREWPDYPAAHCQESARRSAFSYQEIPHKPDLDQIYEAIPNPQTELKMSAKNTMGMVNDIRVVFHITKCHDTIEYKWIIGEYRHQSAAEELLEISKPYQDGARVTARGTTDTVQHKSDRLFRILGRFYNSNKNFPPCSRSFSLLNGVGNSGIMQLGPVCGVSFPTS